MERDTAFPQGKPTVEEDNTHKKGSLHMHSTMSSRKRDSDTTVVTSLQRGLNENEAAGSKSRLRVRIKRFHGVARWTWNAGSDDEVCGICQSAFEGVAPGVKFPGDECPVVFGKCGHAFHLQCVATWLNSSRQTCPICRYVDYVAVMLNIMQAFSDLSNVLFL